MTGRSHGYRRFLGPEWLFLLALVPLVRSGRPTTFTHAVLFAVLLLLVLGSLVFRKRLGAGRLALIASITTLPALGLALSRAGRGWSTILLIAWSVGFACYLFRNRPIARPGTGPVVWLVLVSVTWALVFLLVADLFLGGLTASGAPLADRLLGVMLVVSLFLAVLLGLVVWCQRRDAPAAVSAVSLLLLGAVVFLEVGDVWRLWRGTGEVRELMSRGDYESAEEKLGALMDLGERKGRAFLYPDLLVLSARLDLSRGRTIDAVRNLVLAAGLDPKSRDEALDLLDTGLLARLLARPGPGGDEMSLFTDFEYAGQDFVLLDRWGRVVKITRSPPGIEFLRKTPLPFGSTAVDLEILGDGAGMLLLDSGGNITPAGEIGPGLIPVVESVSRPLRDAVDLEVAPGGKGFYVVNGYGDLAVYGSTRILPHDNPHRWRFQIVRDMEIWRGETGLVFLDGHGGVHPVGIVPLDLHSPDAAYWSEDVARDLESEPSGRSLSLITVRGEWGTLGRDSLAPRGSPFPSIEPLCYEISPDGRELAVMGPGGSVEVFDPASRESQNLTVAVGLAVAGREAGSVTTGTGGVDRLGYFDAMELESAAATALPAADPPNLVVRALPGDTPGSLLVLDRLGRIWRWRDGRYEAFLEAPASPAGVDAVAFRPRGDRFILLLDSGELVVTGRGGAESYAGINGILSTQRFPVDFILRDGGILILDAFGRVTPVDLATADLPAIPEVGWDFPIARRLHAIGNNVYILDGLGAIHAPGGVKGPMNVGSVYYNADLVRDLEPDENGRGFFVMDCAGRLTRTDAASPLPPANAIPAGLRDLAEAVGKLEWNMSNGESLEAGDYVSFDHAVDLVFDPRDRTFFVLFRTGKVFIIRPGP